MKYALVTGAAGGMGRPTVALLLKQGYTVFALDQNVGESAENLHWLRADITDANSVAAAMETVQKNTDRLDAIVHFTGIYMLDSLVEMHPETFTLNIFSNVSGCISTSESSI